MHTDEVLLVWFVDWDSVQHLLHADRIGESLTQLERGQVVKQTFHFTYLLVPDMSRRYPRHTMRGNLFAKHKVLDG